MIPPTSFAEGLREAEQVAGSMVWALRRSLNPNLNLNLNLPAAEKIKIKIKDYD